MLYGKVNFQVNIKAPCRFIKLLNKMKVSSYEKK